MGGAKNRLKIVKQTRQSEHVRRPKLSKGNTESEIDHFLLQTGQLNAKKSEEGVVDGAGNEVRINRKKI